MRFPSCFSRLGPVLLFFFQFFFLLQLQGRDEAGASSRPRLRLNANEDETQKAGRAGTQSHGGLDFGWILL
jgi:hypothetical protein